MLHITNGHAVSLHDTGLGGEIVYWVDVLHEGPVPADLDLAELTRVRAAFLTGHWPQRPCPLVDRDAALRDAAKQDEVVLWFEHDLYDQLQLIQILAWFHEHPAPVSMICIGEFPGVDPFYGLGQLTGEQLATLWPQRHAVTERELSLAAEAWRAFRSPDPMSMHELLRQDTAALPFLADALVRHMQEFPSVENGLGRIDRQIVEMVDDGFRTMPRMFPEQMHREERSFLGDTVFADHVEGLVNCRHPLLENAGGEYRLTQTGRDVRVGRADHVRLSGANRWLGGVHLHGSQVLWRWNESRQSLVRH